MRARADSTAFGASTTAASLRDIELDVVAERVDELFDTARVEQRPWPWKVRSGSTERLTRERAAVRPKRAAGARRLVRQTFAEGARSGVLCRAGSARYDRIRQRRAAQRRAGRAAHRSLQVSLAAASRVESGARCSDCTPGSGSRIEMPYAWLYGLAQILHLPQDFAQRVAIFFVYLCCFCSMYYCLRSVAPWLDESRGSPVRSHIFSICTWRSTRRRRSFGC